MNQVKSTVNSCNQWCTGNHLIMTSLEKRLCMCAWILHRFIISYTDVKTVNTSVDFSKLL